LGGLIGGLFGGGQSKQIKLQQEQAAAAQRSQLAQLARDQAEVDQARATGGRGARGSRLLTFLGSQEGETTLG
jgi:hypothetical protein